MAFNIAIDGPAGAGKSTIAKMVAKKLGFIYVDTGAMYRTIALALIRQDISSANESAITEALKDIDVSLVYEDGAQQVLLNGENVSGLIRNEQVGNMASATSVYPAVRAHLLKLQRDMAAEHDVIMDGRDIGTNILPNADVKIYLTASVEERAKRRYLELQEKGISCNIDEIAYDINQRDERDKNREVAPLRQADDANYLDTSDMGIEEVVDRIMSIAVETGVRTR